MLSGLVVTPQASRHATAVAEQAQCAESAKKELVVKTTCRGMDISTQYHNSSRHLDSDVA